MCLADPKVMIEKAASAPSGGGKISKVFKTGWEDYLEKHSVSEVQFKAGNAIKNCKTSAMGCNVSVCSECGHIEIHNNSCRNRNCPECQAVKKEIWVDKRTSEVIDAPYFHVVFTIPPELNPLVYANQSLLYGLMLKCAAQTLLELSQDKKYLGATPGIIEILHTWGQKLNYHPHVHCIVSGAGLTKTKNIKYTKKKSFFIPIKVLSSKFRGKFLSLLKKMRKEGRLKYSGRCGKFRNSYNWEEFINSLYSREWISYSKETFNGFGNALEYFGRYSHRIAISNKRVKKVSDSEVSFDARNYKTGNTEQITLSPEEFIKRMLWHVLPAGFQKIRYYGFLNNRGKKKNLKLIFRIQGKRLYREKYAGMTKAEIIKVIWKIDIKKCPCCGKSTLEHEGFIRPMLN